MFKKLIATLSAIMVLFSFCFIKSQAEYIAPAEKVEVTITGSGFRSFGFLKDGNIKTYKTSNGNCAITIESQTDMYSLYIMFDLEYGSYTITDNTNNLTLNAGEYSFLHEYVKLSKPTKSVTFNFENGEVRLSEITAYGYGSTPNGVQVWLPPLDNKADILLFASHGDDDQLFFAGLFPLYAAEKQCAVQVAYLTDHRNLTKTRTHEMLNGLWQTGITAYPVFGRFDDFRIDDLQGTYNRYAQLGVTKDELQAFVVEQVRRFKPQVAITHDLNGEYGHGMHKMYADLLINSLEITNDETQFAESAKKYGVWDIPKTYIHLYEQNQIVIDYDTPLDSFDGLTAFEVTKKYGYPCHESQQYTWFTNWINGSNTAAGIKTHNPCKFGLYRTTVGEDVLKNDFMENIVKYADQKPPKSEPSTLSTNQNNAKKQNQEQSNIWTWVVAGIGVLSVAALVLILINRRR